MTAESGTRWSRWHSCSGACARRPVACPAAKRRNGWRPPGQTKWPGELAGVAAACNTADDPVDIPHQLDRDRDQVPVMVIPAEPE